ncbi:hypothetical protein D9M68_963120 [compost metagenome]
MIQLAEQCNGIGARAGDTDGHDCLATSCSAQRRRTTAGPRKGNPIRGQGSGWRRQRYIQAWPVDVADSEGAVRDLCIG